MLQKMITKAPILLAACLLTAGLAFPQKIQAQLDGNYPKLANYYINWDVSDEEAKEMAKWDLVILAPQAVERNPDIIEIIRKNNSQTKILVYSLSVDINYTVIDASPLYQRIYPKIQENNWWLYNTNGEHMSGWPNSWLINPARNAPRTNGQNWSDFLPQHVYNEFLKDNKYDGVFFDNIWPSVSWLNQSVDLDGNGQIDSPSERDANWQSGLKHILNETRRLAPDKIIIVNNTSNLYNPLANGRMLEMFPNNNEGGWVNSMKNYISNGLGYQPEYFIVNGGTKNTGQNSNYANLRFGLTSTLLGDGYFSFDYGDQDHGQLWWYDEYDVYLGKEVSDYKDLLNQNSTTIQSSLYQRDFQNGIVVVNSTNSVQSLNFNVEFEKIKGEQDKKVNNGAIVKNISLNPADGLILLRRIEYIAGSPYNNGSFVRVFNKYGDSVRNGFFLYSKDYKGGNIVAQKDINNDGQTEIIVADTSKITVYDSQKNIINTFYPYGEKYNYGINFAINDFENDGYYEFVTGSGRGYEPLVKVFNYQGVALNNGFHAYAKEYKGGVNVAYCDTNGNGRKEIVTGAGYMGGPQVRIFDREGKVLSGGFFAYNETFRGGVNVACGDIDGNGIDEIVTGAGYGGSSHVRYFNSKFQPLSPGFWAFGKDSRTGVRVVLNDLDGDGIKEILAASPDVFTTAFSK